MKCDEYTIFEGDTMKMIFRESTVQITEGSETQIIPKDHPELWGKIHEVMERWFRPNEELTPKDD